VVAYVETVLLVLDNPLVAKGRSIIVSVKILVLLQETQYLKIERGERVVLMVNGWVFMLLHVPVSHVHLFH
jgi:hypothetical protein